MPRRAALSAFFLIAARATGAGATDDDPVRRSVAGAVRRLDLQTALPAEASADASDWWNFDFDPPRWLIWAAVAMFLVILAYILRDIVPAWRSREDDGWSDGGVIGGAAALSPEASLADADFLAGQGRFVDAMHLLLHSLAEIRRRLKLEFSDSLTSREIVRRARLPDDGAAALRGIVTRVELSYFGDHPAARPDYEACRARYEELTGVLTRSAG